MTDQHLWRTVDPTVDISVLRREPDVRGSVQEIYAVEFDGRAHFLSRATDAGSVFDVGSFFSIPGSGVSRTALRHYVFRALMSSEAWQALSLDHLRACLGEGLAAALFDGPDMRELRRQGVRTHHVGLVDEASGKVAQDGIETRTVLIERFKVEKPERFVFRGRPAWDYHRYSLEPRKLLALEHVFRLGNPGGSSVQRRYDQAVRAGGEKAGEALLADIGIPGPLTPWCRFPEMVYDCQTKFEDHDRSLSWQETVHISGVDHDTLIRVADTLTLCTVLVNKLFSDLGFSLWDLKWEAAIDGDAIVVVDTLDHDSVRITGHTHIDDLKCYIHFNKQAVRDYYRIIHQDWYLALEDAKRGSAVDPEGRTFLEVYREGVEQGSYPDIPPLDPAYAQLQAEKYEYAVAGLKSSAEESRAERVSELASREVQFYGQAGKLGEFLEVNAVATSGAPGDGTG